MKGVFFNLLREPLILLELELLDLYVYFVDGQGIETKTVMKAVIVESNRKAVIKPTKHHSGLQSPRPRGKAYSRERKPRQTSRKVIFLYTDR